MSDEGFLSRWSRRKEAIREGKAVEAEPPVAEPPVAVEPREPPPQPSPKGGGGVGEEPQPPPTLEDVRQLTPESDFRRFVAADVPVDVKNAALKKLFSDPHFNVMDRLDVYIDDYNQPDPLPPEMLRQLASADFLGLFREVEDEGAQQSVAQSGTAGASAVPMPDKDADPDLRLQQDDAPGPEGPGEGPG